MRSKQHLPTNKLIEIAKDFLRHPGVYIPGKYQLSDPENIFGYEFHQHDLYVKYTSEVCRYFTDEVGNEAARIEVSAEFSFVDYKQYDCTIPRQRNEQFLETVMWFSPWFEPPERVPIEFLKEF